MAEVKLDMTEYNAMTDKIAILETTLEETKRLNTKIARLEKEKTELKEKTAKEKAEDAIKIEREKVAALEKIQDKVVKKIIKTNKAYTKAKKPIEQINDRLLQIIQEIKHYENMQGSGGYRGPYTGKLISNASTSGGYLQYHPWEMTQEKLGRMLEDFFEWAFEEVAMDEKVEETTEVYGFKELEKEVKTVFLKELDDKIKDKIKMYYDIVEQRDKMEKIIKDVNQSLTIAENNEKLQKNEIIRLSEELDYYKKENDGMAKNLAELKGQNNRCKEILMEVRSMIPQTKFGNRKSVLEQIGGKCTIWIDENK